jgi:hypothetical protein
MFNKDEEWFDSCPLLNRKINMGECYDIQMVRCGFINERILEGFNEPVALDRTKAEQVCSVCPYNQLIDTSEASGPLVHTAMA